MSRTDPRMAVRPPPVLDADTVSVSVATFECEECEWSVEDVAVDAGCAAFDHERDSEHSVVLGSEFQVREERR